MIEGTESACHWIEEGDVALRAEQTLGLFQDGRGKWRKTLCDVDLQAFCSQAAHTMQALGYDSEPSSENPANSRTAKNGLLV